MYILFAHWYVYTWHYYENPDGFHYPNETSTNKGISIQAHLHLPQRSLGDTGLSHSCQWAVCMEKQHHILGLREVFILPHVLYHLSWESTSTRTRTRTDTRTFKVHTDFLLSTAQEAHHILPCFGDHSCAFTYIFLPLTFWLISRVFLALCTSRVLLYLDAVEGCLGHHII